MIELDVSTLLLLVDLRRIQSLVAVLVVSLRVQFECFSPVCLIQLAASCAALWHTDEIRREFCRDI